MSPGDVRELLALYHVDGQAAEELVALAREAKQRPWWRRYDEVLPAWLETYLGLETEASRLSIFELGAVPDLLQTQDYATAVLDASPQPLTPTSRPPSSTCGTPGGAGSPATPDRARHRHLRRRAAPARRRPSMMRAQLEHLAGAAASPHVVIRVLRSTRAPTRR